MRYLPLLVRWTKVRGKGIRIMADIVKIGRHGQVVLPRRVRAAFGLQKGDQLLLTVEDESIVLKRKARRFAEYLDTLSRPPADRRRP
jgi:AbrB family looped-hinge helix DNA binding protein